MGIKMKVIMEKYHGLGNDYLVWDPRKNGMELNTKRVKAICNRNFGVGSDGILYGPIFEEDKVKLRIFNPDGGEAEISGNGVRIFLKYLKDVGYITEKKFSLSTLGGDVHVEFLTESGNKMKVNMGKTTFISDEIPVTGNIREVVDETMTFDGKEYQVTCVSIGNPHCVILMEDISRELVCDLGDYVENSPNFPNRINLQLLKVLDRNNIQIEIYERGAGYTLSSGSSSCAAASVAYKLGLVDNQITVHMPGGNLEIEILPNDEVNLIGTVNNIGSIILANQFVEELQFI